MLGRGSLCAGLGWRAACSATSRVRAPRLLHPDANPVWSASACGGSDLGLVHQLVLPVFSVLESLDDEEQPVYFLLVLHQHDPAPLAVEDHARTHADLQESK
jgi:hypothetical protein